LLAGIVIAMYITETEIPLEWKTEIIHYLTSTVNKDGGWGLHSAGDSTVFATTLYYITLRILGLESTHPLATKARARLHALGKASCFRYQSYTYHIYRWGNWKPPVGKALVSIVESLQLGRSESNSP
jgi:Squalene-hopene cyclase N-terminal domain